MSEVLRGSRAGNHINSSHAMLHHGDSTSRQCHGYHPCANLPTEIEFTVAMHSLIKGQWHMQATRRRIVPEVWRKILSNDSGEIEKNVLRPNLSKHLFTGSVDKYMAPDEVLVV